MSLGELPTNVQRRVGVVTVVLTVMAASLFFRLLILGGLEHTSLVFMGIPALLAIITAFTSPPRTATGSMLRVVTLALLIAGVALGEAFVCILFAAPLFYFVAIVIVYFLDRRGPRSQQPTSLNLRSLVFVICLLIPASLEGVLPGFEFARDEVITVTRVVDASADDVEATLARTPRFTRRLPLFLMLGFPRPASTSGEGLEEGAIRRIEFLHGHHPGTLVLTVRHHAPGFLAFAAQSDDSYIIHWLSWQRAEVRWREIAPGRTEVSWTLSYRRRLDPAWYFKPLERYGVSQAASYLIDTLATPQDTTP